MGQELQVLTQAAQKISRDGVTVNIELTDRTLMWLAVGAALAMLSAIVLGAQINRFFRPN